MATCGHNDTTLRGQQAINNKKHTHIISSYHTPHKTDKLQQNRHVPLRRLNLAPIPPSANHNRYHTSTTAANRASFYLSRRACPYYPKKRISRLTTAQYAIQQHPWGEISLEFQRRCWGEHVHNENGGFAKDLGEMPSVGRRVAGLALAVSRSTTRGKNKLRNLSEGVCYLA